ncbi:hypothetical protein AHAS_Ahas16G0264400 [Arachis hypogaea]
MVKKGGAAVSSEHVDVGALLSESLPKALALPFPNLIAAAAKKGGCCCIYVVIVVCCCCCLFWVAVFCSILLLCLIWDYFSMLKLPPSTLHNHLNSNF